MSRVVAVGHSSTRPRADGSVETDATPCNPAHVEKPVVKLIGADGNAFNILGLALRAARQAGWSKEQRDEYQRQATSGDYDHLLSVTMDFFDVQ